MPDNIIFKSKLNIWPLIAYGALSLFVLPAVFIGYKYYFTDALKLLSHDDKVVVIFPVIFAAIGAWGLYFLFKARHKLVVNEQSIYIGNKQIGFAEIDKIDAMVRSWRGKGWWNAYDEGITITLHNGYTQNININNYTNGRQLRVVCQKISKNLAINIYKLEPVAVPAPVNIYAIRFSDVQYEPFEKYVAPVSFMAVVFNPVYMVLFFGLGVIFWPYGDPVEAKTFGMMAICMLMFAMGLFTLFIMVNKQHYFLLSPHYLVIKSRVLRWRTAVIPLGQIKRFSPEGWDDYQGIDRGDAALILTSDYCLHQFRMPGRYTKINELFDKDNGYMQQQGKIESIG